MHITKIWTNIIKITFNETSVLLALLKLMLLFVSFAVLL